MSTEAANVLRNQIGHRVTCVWRSPVITAIEHGAVRDVRESSFTLDHRQYGNNEWFIGILNDQSEIVYDKLNLGDALRRLAVECALLGGRMATND